jgi:hypothetical protein
VGAAHDAIVLETVAVEFFPISGLGRDDVFNPGHGTTSGFAASNGHSWATNDSWLG